MSDIQSAMLAEMDRKTIFDLALRYGKEYIDASRARNVYPTAEAIANLGKFDGNLNEAPASAEEVLAQLHEYGSPATVSQIGGRYFGFVNGSAVPVGVAAKLLGTIWDQNTAMYVLSPIAAKLEAVVEGWLRDIFKLPETVVAGFVSGTSMANLCGLAAARYRLLMNQGWDVNAKGLAGAPPVRIIAGKDAHSTVIKTISLLGFGYESVQFVDTDDQGRIRIEQIPELTANTLLILQAGNVNSGSFDDFSSIVAAARKKGAWVHIDGAFGLWASAAQRLSYLTLGMEAANSWAVDGHKTLNTPYDCGLTLCADKEALTNALHMSGGYLVLSNDRDGMFYTPEMSRRARVVELWATMRYLGKNGIEEMIVGLHERARQFALALSLIKGFHIVNEVVFNQVIVRCETDEITNRVIELIQQDRTCWVGGSTWKGRRVIRVSVCSWATTERDIDSSVNAFKSAIASINTK